MFKEEKDLIEKSIATLKEEFAAEKQSIREEFFREIEANGAEVEILAREKNVLEDTLGALQKEHAKSEGHLKEKLNKVKEDVNGMKKMQEFQYADLKRRNEELTSENSSLEVLMLKKANEVHELKKELLKQERDRDYDVRLLRTEKVRIEESLADLTDRLECYENGVPNRESVVLKEKLDERTGEVDRLRNVLNGNDFTISQIKAALEAMAGAKAAEAAAFKNEKEMLKKEIARVNEEMTQLQQAHLVELSAPKLSHESNSRAIVVAENMQAKDNAEIATREVAAEKEMQAEDDTEHTVNSSLGREIENLITLTTSLKKKHLGRIIPAPKGSTLVYNNVIEDLNATLDILQVAEAVKGGMTS
uniref:Uncharacterized protein n=1 Tax=Ditylum brightwellii TaxID=49249 RepID=A0A7S4T2F7_9STRA